MKALREQTVADLEAKVIENRKQLLDLRFQLKLGNKVKTHMIRKLKREIQVINLVFYE